MNIKIVILSSLFLGLCVSGTAQKNGGYKLDCQFKGLPDRSNVYLVNSDLDTVGRTTSTAGNFFFQGKLPLDGRFHFICFDKSIKGQYAIFLVNSLISVVGTIGESKINVKGSDGHLDYMEIVSLELKPNEPLIEVKKIQKRMKLADSIELISLRSQKTELVKKLNSRTDEVRQFYLKWIESHPNSLYTPKLILKYIRKSVDQQAAYDKLFSEVKVSYYGVELNKGIEQAMLAEKVKPGKELPDFKLSSPDGNSISVLEYVKKGKITLIDFWASWCHPCRAEIPNMKKVYDTFHNKGFRILGVSTDSNIAAWKKAIIDDNAPWVHGRDSDKVSNGIFGIAAIPAFLLVDGEGKLLAFSCGTSKIPTFGPPIRGEGLFKTIETFLNGNK